MIRPFLIGVMAGMRSLTPIAVISAVARKNILPADAGAPAMLSSPTFGHTATVLAAGELLGDKMRSAPDRIVAAGMVARIVTGAVGGMAVARRDDRLLAAALGAAGAVGAGYLTFALRTRAMRRWGRVPTGLIEDLATLCGSLWVVSEALGRKHGH